MDSFHKGYNQQEIVFSCRVETAKRISLVNAVIAFPLHIVIRTEKNKCNQ